MFKSDFKIKFNMCLIIKSFDMKVDEIYHNPVCNTKTARPVIFHFFTIFGL